MSHKEPRIEKISGSAASATRIVKMSGKQDESKKSSSQRQKPPTSTAKAQLRTLKSKNVLLLQENEAQYHTRDVLGDSKPRIASRLSKNKNVPVDQNTEKEAISEIVLAAKALIMRASPDERAQIASISRASVLPDYDQQLIVESKVKERWKRKPPKFSGSASDFVSTYYKDCINLGLLNLAMLRRIDEDLYHAYHSRISVHTGEKIDIPTKSDVVKEDLRQRKIGSTDAIRAEKDGSPETPASKREKERTRGMLRTMGI